MSDTPADRSASRRPRWLDRHGAALKAAAALVCALVTSGVFIHQGSEAERTARVLRAQQAAAEQMAGIGTLPIGGAFLQEGGDGISAGDALMKDPTSSISWPIIGSIDCALDPLRGDGDGCAVSGSGRDAPGGLFPLRKAMEQLAGMLIIPLVLISILHALFTKRGGADQHMTQVAIQFFTVIFLLWAYPYWDTLLYRKLAIPLAETLTNGEVVRDVVRGVGMNAATSDATSADPEATAMYANLGDSANWPREGDTEGDVQPTSPMHEIGAYFQNSMQCQMDMAQAGLDGGPGSDRVAQACFGSDVPKVRQLMHANDVQAVAGREESEEFKLITTSGPQWWQNVVNFWGNTDLVEVVDWFRNLPNTLSDTFTGWMIQFMHWLGVFIIWFVWLAIIVARAFSLSLAPVAIVWGLVPGGQDKPKKWFSGHAQIVFMPVVIALGLLVFWAMMMAVLAMDFGTGAGSFIVGAGVKLALLAAMIGTLWKSSTLTKLMAGDVTGVATDFGNSFRTKSVQIAGTALVAAGGAAGAAAGAGASHTSNVMGALRGTTVGHRLAQVGEAGSSLLDRFGLGRGTGVSGVDKVVRGGRRVARETGRVARNVWEGRTTEADAHSVIGAFRSGVLGPMREFASEMKRARGDTGDRRAETPHGAGEDMESIARSRELRDIYREDVGMQRPHTRDGEEVGPGPEDVQVAAGRSNADYRYGNSIGQALVNLGIEKGVHLDLSVDDIKDGNLVNSLDAETIKALTHHMEEDEDFRKLVEAEAERTFGSLEDAPTVSGHDGPLPDLRKLIDRSSAFSNGMLAAAEVLNEREAELFRRELASHTVGANDNSVLDRAARQLDPDFLRRRQDESDLRYYKRINAAARQVLSAASRQSGVEIDQNIHAAEGGFSAASADLQSAISQAAKAHKDELARRRQQVHLVNGENYGLDYDRFVTSGGSELHFSYADDSIMDRVVAEHGLEDDPDAAYEKAVQRALRDRRIPKRAPGQSKEEYLREVRALVHDLVFLPDHIADERLGG